MPKRTIVSLSQDAATPAYKKRSVMSTKRKRKIPAVQMLSAPGTPFPTRCKAQLKYTSYANVDIGVGSTGVQLVRCNSLYDPDFTGVGGQPRGFDQYAALYDQYTVINARIKVWPVQQAGQTAGNDRMLCGISIVDDSGITPTLDSCADRPYTTYKVCHPYCAASDQMISSNWNRYKRFPKNDTYQNLSAQISANPAEQEFFQIWAHSAFIPLSTDPSNITFQYEVIYDCEFYELKQIPASS